ncbi:MAG: hypothetical protein R6V11_02710 [Ectothiorhodospiraceae bacterium]
MLAGYHALWHFHHGTAYAGTIAVMGGWWLCLVMGMTVIQAAFPAAHGSTPGRDRAVLPRKLVP